jgi:hypothetical protein
MRSKNGNPGMIGSAKPTIAPINPVNDKVAHNTFVINNGISNPSPF